MLTLLTITSFVVALVITGWYAYKALMFLERTWTRRRAEQLRWSTDNFLRVNVPLAVTWSGRPCLVVDTWTEVRGYWADQPERLMVRSTVSLLEPDGRIVEFPLVFMPLEVALAMPKRKYFECLRFAVDFLETGQPRTMTL